MKKNWIGQCMLLGSIFFTGCATLGNNFFIRNYNDQSVHIKYIYFDQDNITNSSDFRYQPESTVLKSDTLLKKKVFGQFYNKSYPYFDSINVDMIDSLQYQFDMPARSTIRIAPVYYGENIACIIINKRDTIKFNTDYPFIEIEALEEQEIFETNLGLLNYSYYLLNVRPEEITEILEKCVF
jgi:hypothetical protein